MRVIQISDFHLNKGNLGDLKDFYMEAFINDLKTHHTTKPIDIVLITGDLVDKGGDSLGIAPYADFDKYVIQPIINSLGISSNSVLMVPGNHDINREVINKDTEYVLSNTLSCEIANNRASDCHTTFNFDNNRIEKFKNFEKTFHQHTPNYNYSNNESCIVVNQDGKKVGFALINDSWRCSAELRKDQHFFGYKQLFRARNYFNSHGTELNFAVFHHPLNAINDDEAQEVRSILKTKNFDVAIFGHSHRHAADRLLSASGGYLSINGRSAFSDPDQLSSLYQPGYNIIDLDIDKKSYKITARKFIKSGYRFDLDTDALPNGIDEGFLPKDERLYQLAVDSNNDNKELPDSFTADVDRIVGLLIGESIYPDRYAFVREIIQNSVDACNRVKENNSYATPKITINIDTTSNYFEVADEGDGMTKSVIKSHFAVIGKSISQEHNDNSGKKNLISKFGIGFISTFIAAEKVIINTKNENDERIVFEVENVFKGFKYSQPAINGDNAANGTTVRVYLKSSYNAQQAYQHVRQYCRHIENLHVNFNSQPVAISDSWNVEGSSFIDTGSDQRYEYQLGIGEKTKNIIASYSGFLITNSPFQILPFRFPSHIGGEINFSPKGIDFDVSRTNILPTQKAADIRKDISFSIRKLFRSCLEQGTSNLQAIVVGYLQYYIQNYDANHANMQATYKDFYTKKELFSLCAENLWLDHTKVKKKLIEIIMELKALRIDRIYLHPNSVTSDYHSVVIQYLESKNNLVIKNYSQIVNFHDSAGNNVSLSTVVQLIAAEYGLSMTDISRIPLELLADMKLDKGIFPLKLTEHIHKIEKNYSVEIEIGKFAQLPKASITNINQIFLNFNHPAFDSLLENVDTMDEKAYHIYLLGLLGLSLKQPN